MNHTDPPFEPNFLQARNTAILAHRIVVKLQEIGLPDELENTIGDIGTDLADLCSINNNISSLVEKLINDPPEWESMANTIIDLKSTVEHMNVHAHKFGKTANKIARFAYKEADK